MIFLLMNWEQQQRVTLSLDLGFKHPHNSLCGGVVLDILRPVVEGLKKLLEECLIAKQFISSMFESVASALQDLR